MDIHETALVYPGSVIGEGVKIGCYSVIGPKVKLGKGCVVGQRVIIEGDTQIGENCAIYTGAVIGSIPQDLKYKGEDTKVIIGKNTIVREYVTINKGTGSTGETRIGDNCFLMAYVHVAHDCLVGNRVILANVATLAGHVTVEDRVIIGGVTPIHQFVRIGRLAIVGGASRVSKDIPPYCKAAGSPIKLFGLNIIGLRRVNFSSPLKKELKKVYKIFFNSNLNTTQALEKLQKGISFSEEVKYFINFVKQSKRGICK
ncbi:acyl-ACP--UDP-N-acetylglucosamine O-acyltransferase [bacterium]|nr:acyl-ACP--UDP-N-acetylglucosamine O-acyltransferase [bacterium]